MPEAGSTQFPLRMGDANGRRRANRAEAPEGPKSAPAAWLVCCQAEWMGRHLMVFQHCVQMVLGPIHCVPVPGFHSLLFASVLPGVQLKTPAASP